MIARLFTRQVASEKTLAHFCQVVCSLTAALVLVFGFRRLAALDLSSQQLYSDTVGTLLLAGLFVILALLCHVWRRAV